MARGRRTEEGDAVPRAEGAVTRSAARGASLTAPVHSTGQVAMVVKTKGEVAMEEECDGRRRSTSMDASRPITCKRSSQHLVRRNFRF